jgi:secreted trypsin-like serine protease
LGCACRVGHLFATLGLYDLVVPDETAFDVKIDKVIAHPHYDDLDNDLGLFRLEREVEFSKYIQPVCLIGEPRIDLLTYSKERRCYVVGYGMTEGMKFATKLQKLSIQAREPSECNETSTNPLLLKKNTVCIGPNNERDVGSSCMGDSGGPNLCYEPETDRWHLFAVVSYGPSECDRELGDKWLSAAVDLTKYNDWIVSTALVHENEK